MQTGSLSAVEYFAKNPYDGIKSEWQDFEAELRTAINANCGDNGIEYLFTRWPNNKIDNPQFLPKRCLKISTMPKKSKDKAPTDQRREFGLLTK